MKRIKSITLLKNTQKELQEKQSVETTIRICATGCRALGALDICHTFEKEINRRNLKKKVRVVRTGCHGFCAGAPILVIDPQGIFYQKLTLEDVPEIIEETVLKGKIIERLCWKSKDRTVSQMKNIPFYKNQTRVVLQRCGIVDPTSLEDALAHGAYSALTEVLESFSPEGTVEEIKKSGLRGRGGAGFPTGLKWEFTRRASGKSKYLICNADEGDPGAFMDRALLEGDPHLVIEGMLIAAYAVGASQGYIYVRAEYPIAVEHTTQALRQAREAGLLGKNILGKSFDFNIEIRKGAGAFVCGEETALMASVEGKRGMPRTRPPFPANSGLYDKPTCINNVETLANISSIFWKGASWYSQFGTEKSKGTKIFALAGKVNNTGLVEVPMGATLRQIVFDIGGGIPGGRKFKAAQMGGPSGGCVPAKYIDLPIDYDSVKQVGAIMGSGGMIVMDENTCMVDIARFFTEFVQKESCGKCVPCRIGTKRMHEILERICNGNGEDKDIELLENLGKMVAKTSLCGLGQTAPNPVLTTIRYFRNEYEAHIVNKKCPAGVCKELLSYSIDEEKCKGCGACIKVCPVEAIRGEKREPHEIDETKCVKCGTCYEVCKFAAVKRD